MKASTRSLAFLILLHRCSSAKPQVEPTYRIDIVPKEQMPKIEENYELKEETRKYELTVAAIHTVRAGDTVQEFEAKILPARQALLIFDGDSSTSTIEMRRYHIMPRDRGATFTVYIHNDRVVDYLIVGF